jgi:DNA-binding NtrC family response regulator
MPNQHRVLVVDDDAEVTRLVCDMLEAQGYRAKGVTSGNTATRVLEEEPVDVVITDLRMGDVSGLDLIAWIKRFDPRIAVVAITAFGSIDTAIRAIKLGAFDYVTKPFSPEALLLAVEKATRERQMRVELVRLREEVDRSHGLDGAIGKSPTMQEIFALVRRVAPTPTTVLITGASGTGKEILARAIHALSPRKTRRFLTINCASIPEEVLEAELFGVDVDGRPQRPGGFREDLFYRLHVVEIRIPPLRDRPEDITPLAQHFLSRYAERVGKKIVGFSEAALKQLASYAWPGNVRELENFVERAVTLCEHNVVRPEDLPDLISTRPDTDFLAMAAAREMTLAEVERAYMLRVLERTGGNKLRAAQILGIDRKTIYRWLGGQNELAHGGAEKGEA